MDEYFLDDTLNEYFPLWDGIYIVIPDDNGQKFGTQTAGVCCTDVTIKGIPYGITDEKVNEYSRKLAEQNYVCYEGEKTHSVKGLIKLGNLPLKCIDSRDDNEEHNKKSLEEQGYDFVRVKFGDPSGYMSHEAWQWCKVTKMTNEQKEEFSFLKEDMTVLLVYTNSD